MVAGLGSQVSNTESHVIDFCSRIAGLGSRVSGFGSRVSSLVSQVSGFGSWISGLGSWVSGVGFGSRISGGDTGKARTASAPGAAPSIYKGNSLTRKCTPLGPYCRPMLRVLGGS